MFKRYLVGLSFFILFMSCSEDSLELKTPINFENIFVTEINNADSVIYQFQYENDKIKSIIKRTKVDVLNNKFLVDSLLFFYKNNILDSAVFYEHYIYRKISIQPDDGVIDTPFIPGIPLGIFYSNFYGLHYYKDTVYSKFEKSSDKVIRQKLSTTFNFVSSPLDYSHTYVFDDRNRLVETQRNFHNQFGNQYIYYDRNDNVVNTCLNSNCFRNLKFDDNPNPYFAVNDKLGIPLFFQGLSKNNAIVYETMKGYDLITQTDQYSYDALRRPISINDHTTIKYK